MTAQHDLPPELAEASSNGAAPANSVIGRLRAHREEKRVARHKDIPVPGYHGDLVARYRPVEWVQLRRIAERAARAKDPEGELAAQADIVIAACEQLLVREDGRLRPLAEVVGSPAPVRFDVQLAEALGIDVDENSTARSVLFAVFDNDLAISNLFSTLNDWQAGVDEEVDEDLVGESSATLR